MKRDKNAVHLALVITALIIFKIQFVIACDACGSGMSSYNPEFTYTKTHSISFGSHFRSYEADVPVGYSLFHGYHTNDGHNHSMDLGTINYEEKLLSYELRGIYYPVKNLALSAMLPFMQRKLFQTGELLENKYGLGDLILLGEYHLINKTSMDVKPTGHRFSLGGGFKFPTGKYQMEGYNGVVEPTRQLGTGSFDFLLNTQYLFLVKDFGVNTFMNYKINTQNKHGFKFANMFNSSIKLFYNKAIKSFGLIPNVGLSYEKTRKDKLKGEIYELDTGGELLSNTFGIDFFLKEAGLSFIYYLPVYESLVGVQFENKHRFTLSARYVFKDKKNAN